MLALYGHPFSSYTWKALIALYATEKDFEFREVGPGYPNHAAFVDETHPQGKFPILRDDDTVIIEATAIIEYLAVAHPGATTFIPRDPQGAVRTRMIDRVFDNYVMTNMQRVVSAYIANSNDPDPQEVEAGKRNLQRAYVWLEQWLSNNMLDQHVSLVTCAAAPSLFYADWVEPIPATTPRLAALRAELLDLPEVSRCVEDARPYRSFFPPGAPDRD